MVTSRKDTSLLIGTLHETHDGKVAASGLPNMIMRWKKNYLVIVGIILVLLVIYIISKLQTNFSSNILTFSKTRDYSVWPPFQARSTFDNIFFRSSCAVQRDFSITGLVHLKAQWAQSRNYDCQRLYQQFESIFTLEGRDATLDIPEPFQKKVRGWLGNNEELFNEVYHQKVIHVINRYSREHTVFNPLRDKRPVLPPKVSEKKYFDDIVKDTEKSCDFCQFKDFTAQHTFGRVESKHAFSASNIFKVDSYHALLALKKHNPLAWNEEEMLDLMNLVLVWVDKANQHNPDARYPSLIWDVLPKCGASQVHPHLHVVLDTRRHHGEVESWRLGAQEYFLKFGSNYFSDLVTMYTMLNLTVKYGDAVAFASLVPKKDHEVVVMAQKPSRDFFSLLYFVLRGFVDDLDKHCFSMGMGLPAVGDPEGKLPAYARVITRGVVTDIRADMSSLELFMATNVNIDPYKTIQVVQGSVDKRGHPPQHYS